MKLSWNFSRLNPDADTLVLLLHGMNCSPKTLSALTDTIQSELSTAELRIPTISLTWHHRFDLRDASRQIADYLAEILKQRTFRSLILIGHSAGGVLVQSIYLDLRETIDLTMIPAIRLILIAPLTRGWTISHHLPLLQKVSWLVGLKCAPFVKLWEALASRVRGKKPQPMWILQLQRGSPFIVDLRLRWLKGPPQRPLIYILLGSVDEIVSWRDMVDEVLDGDNVYYREVPFSDHVAIVNIEDKEHGARRAEIILNALTETPASVLNGDSKTVKRFVPWDNTPLPTEPKVERVVFVIHGIRDEGHWTQKIAARARKLFVPEHESGEIAVETSSYGYFSLLEFLSPSARREKIHWLMDEYVEAKRRFPNAKFSYISHSNGTYLLAQALLDYPEVEFERIAFAGSVITSRYNWQKLLDSHRVSAVLNFTANGDWVVSFFPRILRIFVGRNLGGAGVLPFFAVDKVNNNTHVIGGHGAAIAEWNWDNLARFAISKPDPFLPSKDPAVDPHYTPENRWWCSRENGDFVAAGVLLLIILLLVGLGRLAWINPVLFWAIPVAVLVVSALLLSGFTNTAEGKNFSERKIILKRGGRVLMFLAAVVGVWFLVPLAGLALDSAAWLLDRLLDVPRVASSLQFGARWLLHPWESFPYSVFSDLLQKLEQHFLIPVREAVGALRMLSLATLAIGLWKILTKV